jgi:hypothetical protein
MGAFLIIAIVCFITGHITLGICFFLLGAIITTITGF